MLVAIATGFFTVLGFLIKSMIDSGSRRARTRKNIEEDLRLLEALPKGLESRDTLRDRIEREVKAYATVEEREPGPGSFTRGLLALATLFLSGFLVELIPGDVGWSDFFKVHGAWFVVMVASSALAVLSGLLLIGSLTQVLPSIREIAWPAPDPDEPKTFSEAWGRFTARHRPWRR